MIHLYFMVTIFNIILQSIVLLRQILLDGSRMVSLHKDRGNHSHQIQCENRPLEWGSKVALDEKKRGGNDKGERT